MNTIELKLKFTQYKDWKNGVLRSTDIGEVELKRKYNLYSNDGRLELINILRRADQDFNPNTGAQDKNLRYEIMEIVFYNGFASGPITREALDNKIGYKPLYPKSRD